MKINRIDIDLSKDVKLDESLFVGSLKYLIIRSGNVAHFYNMFDCELKDKLVTTLKKQNVYIDESDVSIYSEEGFMNTLDILYEFSICETIVTKNCYNDTADAYKNALSFDFYLN